jgi:hypothetical protein
MDSKRIINIREEALLDLLVEKASINLPIDWKEKLMVKNMNDGGMGSLKLFTENSKINRKFGSKVSEYVFKDIDEVKVIASLYLDTEGVLYEIDIWKTDFNSLIELPEIHS